MSLFSLGKKSERIGAIIDIGSGSVLVAIISSKVGVAEPTVIWNYREHAPLRHIESIEQSAKSVLTALVNALLKFDSEGRRALYEYNKNTKIPEVQCFISAPWSYTITKSINYTQPEPFEITTELIEELVRTAEKKTTVELGRTESATNLGLAVVARTTMDLLANGYRTVKPVGQYASDLSLSHASVVTQNYLIEELEQLRGKLFPEAQLHTLSKMLAFYNVVNDVVPNNFDTCLIDITYEATEIGIVRDGSLRYATHTSFGSFSLAREIATVTSVPLFEAFQYLHQDEPYHFMERLPQSQRDDIENVFLSYVDRLADLFHETGDDLSIPKQILVHADLKSEALFTDLIKKAAKRVLKSDAIVTLVTPTILKNTFPALVKKAEASDISTDTGMLLSALFFHKESISTTFEYL